MIGLKFIEIAVIQPGVHNDRKTIKDIVKSNWE